MEKKIKLLFVISNFNIGGPQKSLIALFDKIDYEKFSVDLMILSPGGSLTKYINKNVKVLETPPLLTAFTLPADNITKHLKTIYTHCGVHVAVDAVKQLIKGKTKYDNISVSRQWFWFENNKHVPVLSGSYDAAFGILGLSTYYIINCVNAKNKYHWIRSDTRILHHDESIDSLYFKECTGFLSVSKDCAKIFEDIYPFSEGNIRTFYNYIPETFYASLPVDTDVMKSDCGEIKIITVCRLDPFKGLEMAIDACKILKDEFGRIKWFVLGDGKYRAEVEKMIKDKGLEDTFILLGFQYNTLAFINKADIVVHPSRSEGKSNAVDEALYCCKPTIVTNYPTAKEVITSGKNGIISEMNGESLAECIKTVINDHPLRMSIIEECKKEKFSADANEVLEELC